MQRKLQTRILGSSFWKNLSNKREELFGNKYIAVSEFMVNEI